MVLFVDQMVEPIVIGPLGETPGTVMPRNAYGDANDRHIYSSLSFIDSADTHFLEHSLRVCFDRGSVLSDLLS